MLSNMELGSGIPVTTMLSISVAFNATRFASVELVAFVSECPKKMLPFQPPRSLRLT